MNILFGAAKVILSIKGTDLCGVRGIFAFRYVFIGSAVPNWMIICILFNQCFFVINSHLNLLCLM